MQRITYAMIREKTGGKPYERHTQKANRKLLAMQDSVRRLSKSKLAAASAALDSTQPD